MASKAIKNSLVRHVTTRGYAQAAPALKKDFKIQSSTSGKIFVAAVDNGSPLTRMTVAFKAGSRYEPVSEPGISHVLRSAAGLTTKSANTFITSRKLSQIGASLSASTDREFIYYTVETTQDNLPSAIDCLKNLISNQEFRPWELTDNVPRLKYDIVSLSPQVRAVDLLHKSAFRRGLGNSLFISPKRIGKVSSESLQHFANNNLVAERCAIVIVGDTADKATILAQALQLGSGTQVEATPSAYYGGELRKEMGGELAHVALALQGAPAGTPQALALAVAAKAIGSGPVTKWGSDNTSLSRVIGNIGPFAAAGFNVNYSDNGLFGVVLSVPKDEAKSAVKAVANFLKNPNLSTDSIQAGKNQLKLQILAEAESGGSLAESIAAQCFYTGTAKSPVDIARSVDQLSNEDIISGLTNAAKTRLSMGAAGNLFCVPYVDEI